MEENPIISLKEIEDTLNDIVLEHPDLNFRMHTVTYLGTNSNGDNIYIANIGSVTHPIYIGGTAEQLNRRIEEFHKLIRKFVNDKTNE